MDSLNQHIILFDGVCNLCNSSVQFIIKHDLKNLFRFAALQSAFGKLQLAKFQLSNSTLDTFVYIYDEQVYTKSTAALKIARLLKGGWKIFYVLIVIPPFIRNWFYDRVAKNRYKWFGKKETCMIPTPELKNKFL